MPRGDNAINADMAVAQTTKGRHIDMLLTYTELLMEVLLDCRKYLKDIKEAVETP